MTYDMLLAQERPGVLTFGGARMTLLDIEAGFWALRRQMETLVGPRLTDNVLQQAGANGGASFARAFISRGAKGEGAQSLRDCIAAYQAAGFGQFEILESEWPLGRVLIRGTDAFEAWTAGQHGDQVDTPVCAYTAGVLVGFINVLVGRQDVVCIQRSCQAQGAKACLFELLPAAVAGDAPVVAFAPDPALGRQLNLLELLFDRMPMGIAVLDLEFRIQRYNPTWEDFARRYAPPSAAPLAPGVRYFDHLPGTEATVLPLFERALAGETLHLESVRLESQGIVTFWDVVLAPIFEGEEVTSLLNVTIDATGRVQTHQELEKTLETLRKREERLALVTEGINDGVWDWDIEAGEVYFSPRWKSMLGYAEHEIPDEFEAWQKLIHPDDQGRASAALQEHLAGHSSLYWLEHRLRHKDGKYRWILARGKALRHDDGTPYRLLGSHTDITERRLAEEALHYRAAFESLVSGISTEFINIPLGQIDLSIDRALQRIGQFMAVDRSYLFRFSEDRSRMDCTHEWTAPGIEPQIDQMKDVLVSEFAWSNRPLLQGDSLHVPRVADLPADAEVERREFQRQGIQSLVAVPMVYRGSPLGFVGFDSVREEKTWSEDSIQLLQLVASVFANALEHKRAQEALHEARRSLEQRVKERTRELATLLKVSHDVNSTLELQPLLDLILVQLRTVVDYTGASILILEDGDLMVQAYRGPIRREEAQHLRFSLEDAQVNRQVIQRQEPIVIPDVRSESPLARMFRQTAGGELESTFGYVRAWLGVPLMVKGEMLGMLTLDHSQPGQFTAEHADLSLAFANQVAVAIENARLYQAEQERLEESERRRQVAEGLRGVLSILNSDRPLHDILDYILAQACRLLGAQAAVVYRLALEEGKIEVEVATGMPPEFGEIQTLPYVDTAPNRASVDGRPFAISDVEARWAGLDIDEMAQDPAIQKWISIVGQHFCSYLSAPILVQDQSYGAISLFYDRRRSFSTEEIQLAVSFADQAALAIENARLRKQAQEAAVTAERNRLARDLHDAVTQTLFSASLIAEVLPRLWEQDPEEGWQRLKELRELTRGALAEMRTLLLELRPSALIEAKLSDLLRQLGDSITGRARVCVALQVEGECTFDAEVKVALYRIAQEALNNVAKHAGATETTVSLRCLPSEGEGAAVELCIRDDGLGFDLASVPPDSLGLGIMRERAEAIGAALVVDSQPGAGTQIKILWRRCVP